MLDLNMQKVSRNLSRLSASFMVLIVSVLGASVHTQAAELKVGSNPAVKDKPKIESPSSAARKKQQGWVVFDLDIDPEGKVSKAHLVESFGNDVFVEAATDAVKTWQHKPKKSKGQPVEQFATNVRVDFSKGGKRPISSGFGARKYNKIVKLLSEGKLDNAHKALKKLDFEDLENYAEINLALSLWANYAKAAGDKVLQLSYLEKMALNASRDEEKFVFSSLRERLILQLELNHLVNAKRTFRELKRLKIAKPYLPAFEKAVKQADVKAFSAEDLAVPGKIMHGKKWRHAPARKALSITNVAGKIDAVSLRCSNKVKSVSLKRLGSVKIPNHWSNCYLDVEADLGTSFTVTEQSS
jgi:TonB family protein